MSGVFIRPTVDEILSSPNGSADSVSAGMRLVYAPQQELTLKQQGPLAQYLAMFPFLFSVV